MIGADGLIYQDLSDLIASAREGNPEIEQFDCSVFDGKYITGDIDDAYLDRLAKSRSDGAKRKVQQVENVTIELSNVQDQD